MPSPLHMPRTWNPLTGLAPVVLVACAGTRAASTDAARARQEFVPPPPATLVHTPPDEWRRALRVQAQRASDRAERHARVSGRLEAGSAGLHVARSSKEYLLRYNPDRTPGGQTTDTEFDFLDLLGRSPLLQVEGQLTFEFLSDEELGEHSMLSQVSIRRVAESDALAARVVPAPSGAGFTLELSFTDSALAAFADIVGPTRMPAAGYDWCRFWLQEGETVTQCHAVLVAENEALGSFSIRDLVASGGRSVVLEPLRSLSAAEARELGAQLEERRTVDPDLVPARRAD